MMKMGDATGAIPHLQRATDLDSQTPKYRADLIRAHAQVGDFAATIRILRDALALTPLDFELQTMLARFLATCPDPNVRDAAEAVRIAERLRRLPRGRDAFLLDTLASAYAAAGRFDDARAAAIDAADASLAAGDSVRAAEIRVRVAAYAKGLSPWTMPQDAGAGADAGAANASGPASGAN